MNEQFREGAIAMRNAMRQIPSIVAHQDPDDTKEYLDKRNAAIAALASTLGPLPPAAAGAFSALAEFVVGGEQDACLYNIDRWQPEAAMTEAERTDYHARLDRNG